jgi:type I restriction enzyme S subunit
MMAAEIKNTKAFYNTEIPSDWEIKKLGEVATFINGKAYKQEELLSEGKYKVLRVGNFFTKGEWYYSDLELENDKYVNDGDLMYAWSASFGPQFWNGEKTIYHYHIWKVIASELITKQFLFFLLDYDTQRILSSKQGGTMFHITKGDMEKRKSNIPPLSEQKAIAQVLSTADAAIHTTEKLIAQKELRKKWLMQQLLTGKKRLKGFDGEWKSEILGNVVSLQHGYQFRDEDFVEEGIPVIKIRNVIGYDLVLTDMTFVDESRLDEFKSVIIENGDLLMSLTGNIGRVVEVKGVDKPMFQNYRVGKFTPIDGQLTKSFLKFILSSDILFKQFNGLANQSAQANFGKQDMDKLKFSFPISIEEQTTIGQVLQAVDKEISLLHAKAEKLREQKKGLMQQLLTGKVRLKIN